MIGIFLAHTVNSGNTYLISAWSKAEATNKFLNYCKIKVITDDCVINKFPCSYEHFSVLYNKIYDLGTVDEVLKYSIVNGRLVFDEFNLQLDKQLV